ncbi:MAG: pyrroline-5-carboxylate reductase [Alphaproteobacteria bacterium]|nr:pyrroline-5-carboxylate reductase [Alphaproteobacteria bacterium]
MPNAEVRVLLVGCGKMGGAMLQGWRREKGLGPFLAVEPGGAPEFDSAADVRVVADADAIPAGFAPDVVVFATKPQVMDKVAPPYARFAGRALFVSIAAGKTIAYFRRHLGQSAAIVRAMPNTPAAVGRGITVGCPTAEVSAAQRALADRLLRSVGTVEWVADESLIDAVTAVSGSGPAYVFLLAETLAAAGAKAGLPADLAGRLARATVSGAGELLHQSPESAEQLRKNVTSPNGTTAAALAILMGPGGFGELLEKAVAAAEKRSRELAS